MRIRAFAIVLALAWATIGGARAADVLFTITNTASGKTLATFELPQLPQNPPSTSLLNGVNGEGIPGLFFAIFSVPAVVNGVPETLTNLEFLVTGGFIDDHFFNFSKGQFYTGSESSPTFLSNVSLLPQTNKVPGGKIDTVTVSLVGPPDPPTLAAPELSSWAMLLLGFLGLSYVGYRKAKTSTTLPA
jgi:hypothetical protein